MLWKNRRESTNVEDRRGMSGGGRVAIGGGLGTLVILIIALLLGADPQKLLQQLPAGDQGAQQQAPQSNPEEDQQVAFVKVVLADTEDVWHELFRARGQEYVEPHLVLFSDGVRSGCGNATSAVGPFYCPADSTVYLDLGFFREMTTRFRAPGDFAQAYVIAHEVGHHVQNLLGISGKVDRMRSRLSEAQANDMSVRLELQADFLAGVWAHHDQKMKGILESGDIEEALGAANAIGDDTLQKQSQGYAVPDSFTHGTSAQRIAWFRKGFETGDMRYGDTFSSRDLNRP
ncbi:MAG TPA: neutral zinc metallopeptidase [Blastocatellia bacterium]|nr:neutral zinc metallopeptidase [Blastocatellia bacterium]